ncbi:translation initiation factor IF-2 [Methylovirgula sp. 4M-Z18]|uniref:translation initiation factor IF-2 n=1 Tax=Methylovirgula sp. 4M-Z18 TaxID=2293567 RepID=UPI000E2F8408|nr:translation initiation factor IF-2 [Methylovirgula sp. 4M-Z18]RFB77932.1 translation initiation factor IF-2 [Methylovirgula sp. 4M-Z18]
MTDTKNNGDKTLTVAPTKTLSLKRPVEQGVVRQSFSHGRSKAVVVEKVKTRVLPTTGAKPAAAPAPQPVTPPPAPPVLPPASVQAPPPVMAQIVIPAAKSAPPSPRPVAAPSTPAPAAPAAPRGPTVSAAPTARATPAPQARAGTAAPAPSRSNGNRPGQGRPTNAPRPQTGVVLRTLTDEEREARTRALADAGRREEEDRQRQQAEASARAEREAREKVEREAAEARKREEEARRAHDLEAKRRSEEEAKRRLAGGQPVQSTSVLPPKVPKAATTTTAGATATAPAGRRPVQAEEDETKRTMVRRPGAVAAPKVVLPPRPAKGAEPKMRGRLTVHNVGQEEEERTRSVAAFKRRVQRLHRGHVEQKEKIAREIVLPETITIQELANRMSERGVDVIKFLMKQGQMHKITDVIDADTAELIAEEMGHTVRRVAESDVEEGLFDTVDEASDTVSRPPVVTIMGHVDHGKTSLLDAIRHANVVSGEAGGITQHIGAYQVVAPSGLPITFIDTPGHAAFTAMRARGAKVTDIVVLVVAADDGVMPQTIEAINHARAAKVPLIVAINKVDKPDAHPERVRTELLQYEVQVESLGGDTLEVEVSAKQKTNLDRLLDAIALQAEVLELKANPDRTAEGTVIEARLDRGRGPVATVLVQRGTLRGGDIIVAGTQWGRVRALLDDKGEHVTEAPPSFPVEVLGFNGAPEAGDRVAVVENEARAREITEYRQRLKRDKAAASGGTVRGSLADMMSQLKTAGRKEFPLLIKGDVQGSVEAIISALEKLGNDEVRARVIHAGVGGISESDMTLAEASNAAVIGFNVRAHKEAREAAERLGIEIRYYNIIYNLVDDVKAAMSGLLAPTLRETMMGNALILEVFNISKVGKVAGCRITDGKVERGLGVRLIRDNVVVHEGKLSTLKRFKDEVREVQAGQECGMAFENYQDMRAGDIIECYRVEEVKRSL